MTRPDSSPRVLPEAVRLRIKYLLGQGSKAELQTAVEKHVHEFSGRLLAAKPRLSTLGPAPRLRGIMRELEAQLNATLAKSKNDDVRESIERLHRAGALLADLETYLSALDEIESARAALRRQLELWRLHPDQLCPTLDSLRRVLDEMALDTARKGRPHLARQLACIARREVELLATKDAPAEHREQCPACVEHAAPLAPQDSADRLEEAGYASLAAILRCELETRQAWAAPQRVRSEPSRRDELRERARALAASIRVDAAALKSWPSPSEQARQDETAPNEEPT